MRRFTREEEDAIIDAYHKGASLADAGSPFGRTGPSCWAMLRKRGEPLRPCAGKGSQIPFAVRLQLVEAVKDCRSVARLAVRFGYPEDAVTRALRRHGVTPPNRSEAKRTYSLDEDFFERIDTEAKAYWLGFITADGCVTDNGRRHVLTIGLKASDRGHLEKFAAAIGYARPFREVFLPPGTTVRTPRLASHLQVDSLKIVRDLQRHGVHPRKSFTAEPWQGAAGLMPAYWRGVVDGDGSLVIGVSDRVVSGRRYVYPRLSVQLCGSRDVVEGFASFVRNRLGYSYAVRFRRRIYHLSCSGVFHPRTLAALLYAGATVFLDRKMLLAEAMMATPDKATKWSHLTAEDLTERYARLGSWQGVMREIGAPTGSTGWLLSRLGVS